MAIQVQLRRGTAAQNNAFTGAIGELSFDTTANQVRVHDGSTAGGFKIGVGDFPTGTNNVALGNTALDDLDGVSPGGSNTAVGHDALTANTTASNNVAVGKDALKANTTAASSTAVGTSALAANTGTLNTAIGKDAGSLITSGTKNTIVGSFDGNQGGLDIRTSNSHIVLSDGDGNPRLIIDNNGNVDIGDATTELKLKNTTHEDTDGGRESKITFQGEQSGGEQSVLAQIQASHDGASDDEKGDLIFRTNDGSDGSSPTEAMRIESDQQVLITTSADAKGLTIKNSGNNRPYLNMDANRSGAGNNLSQINFKWDGTDVARIIAVAGADTTNKDDAHITFGTASAGSVNERARIDSSGNVLIGKTSTSSNVAGSRFGASGNLELTRSGGQPLYLNRQTNDGNIIRLDSGGTATGGIGVYSGDLFVVNAPYDGAGAGLRYNSGFPNILPCNGTGADRDNAIDLGHSSVRFDDVYATNGTIQTSDEREKQQIASLTDAEMTAAKAISKLFKTFKWNDSVAENGDNARTHAGVIAQQVETAMSDAGLDASDYAFFINTTWWETQTEVAAVEAVEAQDAVYDEEGNLVSEAVEAVEAQDAYTRTDTYDTQEEAPEGATERNRKGIRYPELLSFIGAATEQRLTSIEARLDALEG